MSVRACQPFTSFCVTYLAYVCACLISMLVQVVFSKVRELLDICLICPAGVAQDFCKARRRLL